MSMENLEEVIETWANTMLDIMELIPGWGQLVTAGRIAATIAEFFVSGDYKSIKQLFSDEMLEIFKELESKIEQALEPDTLLLFLLFGNPKLDEILSKIGGGATQEKTAGGGAKAQATKKTPVTSGKKGKFAVIRKTIDGSKKIGKAMVVLYRELHAHVQVPVESFNVYASTRPSVAFAFQFIADNIYIIAEMKDIAEQGFTLVELRDQIKSERGGLVDQVNDLLEAMRNFTLPENVVNMEPVVTEVVDYLTTFLGKRLGLKAKIAIIILERTGIKKQASQRIAKEIVEAIDPNQYWRDTIKPNIEEQFNAAREQLVEGLNDVLRAPIFDGAFDKLPAPEKLSIPLEGKYFPGTDQEATPSVQGRPSPDREMIAQPDSDGLPDVTGGEPLTTDLRSDAEVRFGHNFEHVRLHRDDAAGKMTDAYGVDGLTSGSHVYLRTGLQPDYGEGRAVFYHELAHVLQQTGARPLAKRFDNQPVIGKPRSNLILEPAQENAAEAAAHHAIYGKTATPLAFGHEKDEGWQPKVSLFTLSKLMRRVSEFETLEKDTQSLKKLKGKKAKNIPAKVQPVVELIVKKLSGIKKDGVKVESPSVFEPVLPNVLSRLSLSQQDLLPVAHQIALDSLSPPPLRAKKSEPAKKQKRRFVIATHFTRMMERFILAETGIVISMDLNLTAITDTSNAILLGTSVPQKQVDPANPLSKIKILHIHLPFIGVNSPLWGKAINQAWSGNKQQKARQWLRAYLTERGITAGIWPTSSKQYRFSKRVVDDINELIMKAEAGKQPITELPPWNEYVKIDQDEVAADSASSDVGLRLALHKVNKKRGRGRESHHLTQYLLLEYFGNSKSDKPFKPGWSYPGLSPKTATTQVKSFESDIQIDSQINSNRGPDMPSILLAASTHRDSRLHITPKPDEEGSARQSRAVHEVFTTALGEMANYAAMTNKKKGEMLFSQYKAKKGEDTVKQEIRTAMQNTYKWMHGEMAKGLTQALPELELEYYKGLYESIQGPSKEMPMAEQEKMKKALKKIPPLAAKHNDQYMEMIGWRKG
jgi:hypothetical protein